MFCVAYYYVYYNIRNSIILYISQVSFAKLLKGPVYLCRFQTLCTPSVCITPYLTIVWNNHLITIILLESRDNAVPFLSITADVRTV
jgi:hypothetical protein